MNIPSLSSHYALNLEKENFNILRLENLIKLENNYEILLKEHKVNFYTLLFITENTGKHSIDFKDYSLSKGTILAIRKDQIHKFYLNKQIKGFLLCFNEEFLMGYLNANEVAKEIQMFNELMVSPKTVFSETDFPRIVRLIIAIESEYLHVKDNYSGSFIRSFVHILFTLTHRLRSKGQNKVQLNKYLKEFIFFQNLIQKEYANTKKVSDYANILGFSTKKLNMVVSFVVNKSAKSLIDDTVIVKIKGFILHTNLSIKEIAFKVGFNDPAYLYKYFKKHTNLTPEEFRKQYNY